MAPPRQRRWKDSMKLFQSGFKVRAINDGMDEYDVLYYGRHDNPYDGGVWKVRLKLPEEYPSKPPSIAFTNKIYHPNVDEESGSVCPYLIEKAWKPRFDLVYLFEKILPKLLLRPNLRRPPLNEEAASLMVHDRPVYDVRVRDYRDWYAKSEDAEVVPKKPSDATPSDPQPAHSSKIKIEHDSRGEPVAGREYPHPAPSSIETDLDSGDERAAGPVDPRPRPASRDKRDAGPVDPRPRPAPRDKPDAAPVDPQPAPSSMTEDEHNSRDKPDAAPVDPQPAPSSMTEIEHDSRDKSDAALVDPQPAASSVTEIKDDSRDKPDAAPVDPQPATSSVSEIEDDSRDKPDAGPVDPQPAPSSMTEDEHDKPNAVPVDLQQAVLDALWIYSL